MKCRYCKRELPKEEFQQGMTKEGFPFYHSYCTECHDKRNRYWDAKNKEAVSLDKGD